MSLVLDLDGLDGCFRSPVPVPVPVPVPEYAPASAPRPDRRVAMLTLGGVAVGVFLLSSIVVVALAVGRAGTEAGPTTAAGTEAGPTVLVAPPVLEIVPEPAPEPWTVRFAFGDAAPLDLGDAPAWVATCPRIVVTGHTCDLGDADANLAVGRVRAEVLRDRLVAGGVPAERIEVRSAGEAEPAVPNDSREARRANRRVVVACER